MKTERKILLVSVMTLSLLTLAGCGKQADEDGLPDSLTIEPLVGIGPVRFGSTKDEIIAHFGQPDSSSETGLNYVSSRGLSFTIDAELGMRQIKCWSDSWPTRLPFRVTAFAGSTKEGIGMGASREQILAAYGQPDRTGTDAKGVFENLHYDKLGIKFSLWQDRLASMVLEAARSAS